MVLPDTSDLDTLQAIVHRTIPALKLEPSIRSVREDERVPGILLHSLRVVVLSLEIFAVAECVIAIVLQGVG